MTDQIRVCSKVFRFWWYLSILRSCTFASPYISNIMIQGLSQQDGMDESSSLDSNNYDFNPCENLIELEAFLTKCDSNSNDEGFNAEKVVFCSPDLKLKLQHLLQDCYELYVVYDIDYEIALQGVEGRNTKLQKANSLTEDRTEPTCMKTLCDDTIPCCNGECWVDGVGGGTRVCSRSLPLQDYFPTLPAVIGGITTEPTTISTTTTKRPRPNRPSQQQQPKPTTAVASTDVPVILGSTTSKSVEVVEERGANPNKGNNNDDI